MSQERYGVLAGLLPLHGLDSAIRGVQAWRRAVAAAPQFHESCIFSAVMPRMPALAVIAHP